MGTSKMTFVVNGRTSGVVDGIRGQSYPILGIWSLCPWTPVTLLRSPSYPTCTGKVILELRGRLRHILWALRCSWADTDLCGEAPRLCKGGPNILLNLGGLSLHPPLAPALGQRVIGRRLCCCLFARYKRSLDVTGHPIER